MSLYNATPRHATPRHATPRHATPRPASALKFQPEPERQESALKHKLRTTLKQYPFIRYPFVKIVRPILGIVPRTKKYAREFCLRHEPLRSWLMRKKNYRECELSTVYDYCRERDGIIRVYDDSCEYPARPLCRTREEFEANIFAEPVMRPSWYIYLSKIRDAVIWGGEDLIYADGHLLSDSRPQNNKYYISGNIPEIREESALVKMPDSPEIIDKGICLMRMWSENLYHFSFEALTRLQLADAVEEYRSFPIIINQEVLYNFWSIQLLKMVNTYDRYVIPLQHGKPYIVNELLYPSFLSWPGDEKLWYSSRIHTMAADYLREKITSKHKPSGTYRNIYIPRGNNERLLNEDEVIECLKRYGFEIIPQGKDNYSQTLDAFMTADNIIGTMGASMSNTVVAKPEANIYIICPFEFQHDNPGFAVSDASRRRLHFIAADIHRLDYGLSSTKITGLNRSTFSVDISRIEALAKQITR